MSNSIIQVDELGKMYQIRHQGRGYQTIRDRILAIPAMLAGKTQTTEEFWALKDVSFSVERGDRVGIIGRNGAGKSTLLKILSRITKPTHGRAEIRGRVASLLEVGTGFHPELTGRENIFMNGALLGMKRAEIRSKFDEIVAFAEVDKFIDTPVKRYSSGMYVRLAFAVAAHLEPEILLVDEVLAVGDAQFQKKCLGKMEDVSKSEGRTILFVSHNMAAVQNLCNRGVMLTKGGIVYDGSAEGAIAQYLDVQRADHSARYDMALDPSSKKGKAVYISAVSFKDADGGVIDTIIAGRTATVSIDIGLDGSVHKFDVGIGVFAPDGSRIGSAATWMDGRSVRVTGSDKLQVSFQFEKVPFTTGSVVMSVAAADHATGTLYDMIELPGYITVVDLDAVAPVDRAYGGVKIFGSWDLG